MANFIGKYRGFYLENLFNNFKLIPLFGTPVSKYANCYYFSKNTKTFLLYPGKLNGNSIYISNITCKITICGLYIINCASWFV